MDNFSSLRGYDLFCNIDLKSIEIKIAFQFMQYLGAWQVIAEIFGKLA